jgi:hypothetical protein
MMSKDAENQKPDKGFTSVGEGLQELTLSLFGNLQTVPDDADAIQEPQQKKSRPSAKLAKAAATIIARPDKAKTAYLARQVVQCSLPRSNPGNKSVFVRRDGNFALLLEAPTDIETMETVGLPSGSIAKILWLWINTEAVYNKNSKNIENKYRLTPGRTFHEFILKLGLDPNTGGGKFSHARTVREELIKLVRCQISFHNNEGDKKTGGLNFVPMPIVRKVSLWWDERNPDQGTFFESEIILDERFFDAITAAPVPVDMRVVVALVRSPLAIDIYTWATYRIFTMKNAGHREIKIPLLTLKEQFGTEYKRADHFKAALSKALEKIKIAWPSLDYTLDSKALILRVGTGQPAIAPRGKKYTSPALNTPNQISSKVRERFEKRYPLHNVNNVFAEFDNWRKDSGVESRDTDGHFWDFVKNHYFKK